MKTYLGMAAFCAMSALGQILLRAGARQMGPLELDRVWPTMTSIFSSVYVWAGLAVSFCSVMGYMLFLSRLSLNIVFPLFVGMSYAMVVLGGTFILHEKLSFVQGVGIAVILVGLVLVSSTRG